MLIDLFLAINNCKELLKYLAIEDSAYIIGLDKNVLECLIDLQPKDRNIIFIPRTIMEISNEDLDYVLKKNTKHSILGLIPRELSVARRLAKIKRVLTIINNPDNIRFMNEEQVNFMAQSPSKKFIEIHLLGYIKLLIKSSSIVEKLLNILGNTIENALKLDIGVVMSSASIYKDIILPIHMDIFLYTLGFTKRERRLILEVYPMELLDIWIKDRVD